MMKNSLSFFLNKLPTELIEKIRRLSYKTQSKELLDDIINYFITKKTIMDKYFNHFIFLMRQSSPEDLNWLVNDIFIHLNNELPRMFGYNKEFLNLMHRDFMLKNKDDSFIINFLDKTNSRGVIIEINRFWGLLKPAERLIFIKNNTL